MFDPRAFVAKQFGCQPEDFTISRRPVEGYRGREAEYRGDKATVRVLISKPRGVLVSDVHRQVIVSWPGRQVETRIGVDDEVAW